LPDYLLIIGTTTVRTAMMARNREAEEELLAALGSQGTAALAILSKLLAGLLSKGVFRED
jgi:hypothetical protein